MQIYFTNSFFIICLAFFDFALNVLIFAIQTFNAKSPVLWKRRITESHSLILFEFKSKIFYKLSLTIVVGLTVPYESLFVTLWCLLVGFGQPRRYIPCNSAWMWISRLFCFLFNKGTVLVIYKRRDVKSIFILRVICTLNSSYSFNLYNWTDTFVKYRCLIKSRG